MTYNGSRHYPTHLASDLISPKAKGGSDWHTDIVETSNWFPINHAISSHGVKIGKDIHIQYEDNVPSCPLSDIQHSTRDM